MANVQITIISQKYSAEKIEATLKNLRGQDFSWKLQKPGGGIRSRGLDPTVLVAVVGATGTAVGALVAGMFQLISGKKDERIVLRLSNGASIEFPADLPPKKLDEIINKIKALDDEKYQILLP